MNQFSDKIRQKIHPHLPRYAQVFTGLYYTVVEISFTFLLSIVVYFLADYHFFGSKSNYNDENFWEYLIFFYRILEVIDDGNFW